MRKILFLIIGVFLIASTTEKFLDYTNKLVTYNFELKNIDKIKSPFYKSQKLTFLKNKKINKNVKKIIHISLISIFNDMAYIKIDEFMGDELIKTYKKWVKKNDIIKKCKVENIYSDKLILKCGKKLLIKQLNTKSLKIRIGQ
jgi:nanoRNase/pAp phosphatase (c-di-AMP/oligoRNAs hydrolase)